MSLLNRLILLVMLALVPGAVIDVYNAIDLKRSREADIHEQAKRLLGLIGNEQDRLIAGIRQTLASLRQAPAIRDGDTAACTTYMGGLRADPDFPEHLDILAAEPQEIMDYHSSDAGQQRRDHEACRAGCKRHNKVA